MTLWPMVLLILALVCVPLAAQPPALQLSTAYPGNLIPAYTATTVQVKPALDLRWVLKDYDGQQVAEGATTPAAEGAEIKLPALPHGYYELTCTHGEASVYLRLGAITDHSAKPPPSTRLNVDAAASWLTGREHFDETARILRAMGMGWVRERFSWGQTEPERDKVDWAQYDANARAYGDQGVRVYQIFHDSPGWTREGEKESPNPKDLRDVYRFARRLAEHYRGQVQAWEVWNEPDIGFWPDLSDTYAGVQKAAYLGLKSVDKDLMVLQGSFCRGVSEFDYGLLEAGAKDYFDVFNWHIYAPPEAYPGTLKAYLDVLGKFGAADRPVWLTEAGIRLVATEPDGELNAADERRQAEFIPQSLAYSLAAGTDRHFLFVFPYYLENGVQFGVLHRDLSPRPATVALAATLDLLGEATYLGRYQVPNAPGVTAMGFDSGNGRVLLLWSDKPQEVSFDTGARSVTVADLFGKRTRVDTTGGILKLTAGPAAQYISGVGNALTFTGPVRAPGKLPKNRPCPIIVRGQVQVAKLDKNSDSYQIGAQPCTYMVESYNFTAKDEAGTLQVKAPAGWRVTPAEAKVVLEPMGRATTSFTLTPGKPTAERLKVTVTPRFAGYSVAPSVSHVAFDFGQIPAVASADLGLDKAEQWENNISGNGTMTTTQAGDAVHFDIKFSGQGDRWAYPRVAYGEPQDFSKFQGISFEYRTNAASANTNVRLQLYEPGGASYLCDPLKSSADWTTSTLRFSDLSWGSFSPPDPNGRFDPGKVNTVMVGINTPEDVSWLEVRNLRLVRW